MHFDFVIIRLLLVAAMIMPLLSFAQTVGNSSASSNSAIEEINKTIVQKKDKIKELEASIEQTKKNIDQKKLQATSLRNQMAILDNHILELNLRIALTEEKLDATTLRIEQLRLEIQEKQTVIAREKNLIASLLRYLQHREQKTTMELLVSYENFSDFYTTIHNLQTVSTHLGQSVMTVRLAKEDLESKEKTTTDQKQSYEALKKEQDQEKSRLDEQLFSKERLLAQTKSSELTYTALLRNLRKQYQDIEAEILQAEAEARRRLEAQQELDESLYSGAPGELAWPTQSHVITTFFHDPDYPYRYIFEHGGIDIRSAQGSPIRAAGAGYIAYAKSCTTASCYSYISIIHSNGISTRYGHLSSIGVAENQFVARGDIIGYSGGTPGTRGAGPFVTGPHLHFEVRKDGIPINPLGYLGDG